MAFQPADLLADSPLGDGKFPRCRAVTALARGSLECAQGEQRRDVGHGRVNRLSNMPPQIISFGQTRRPNLLCLSCVWEVFRVQEASSRIVICLAERGRCESSGRWARNPAEGRTPPRPAIGAVDLARPRLDQ